MAEPGPQVQGVPAPPPPPAQVQPGQQAPQQKEHHAPPAQLEQQIGHLNWSYFKPEKHDKDTEAHLLCTNDWMTTYHFVEGVKVQKIC